MNREQVWRDFDALSPQAQEQVADFIALLRSQTDQTAEAPQYPAIELAEEPFIGLWQDRDDMQDSSDWVRQLRTSEWTRPHG